MTGGTPIFRKADVATVSNNSEENTCFFQGIPLIVGMITHTLVGGLVAIFYFPINIGLLIIPID